MSHALFDALQTHFKCTTDIAVGDFLDVSPRRLTDIRKGRDTPSPALILRIYDKTGMSIEQIRALVADTGPKKLSQRAVLKAKTVARKAAKADLLAALVAKPAKPKREGASVDEGKRTRLTVTKAHQWTSTVHRVL